MTCHATKANNISIIVLCLLYNDGYCIDHILCNKYIILNNCAKFWKKEINFFFNIINRSEKFSFLSTTPFVTTGTHLFAPPPLITMFPLQYKCSSHTLLSRQTSTHHHHHTLTTPLPPLPTVYKRASTCQLFYQWRNNSRHSNTCVSHSSWTTLFYTFVTGVVNFTRIGHSSRYLTTIDFKIIIMVQWYNIFTSFIYVVPWRDT